MHGATPMSLCTQHKLDSKGYFIFKEDKRLEGVGGGGNNGRKMMGKCDQNTLYEFLKALIKYYI